MSKRSVSYVKLHQAMFSVGLGNLGAALAKAEHKGIEMYKTENGDGIDVLYKGIEFWVPAANIIGAVYEKSKSPAWVKSA